jgi:hypothetical protein
MQGTCASGACSYTPIPPSAPQYTCNPPTTGQTLNGVAVSGFCIAAVYYCTVSGVMSVSGPSGFVNAMSVPGGCDFNGVSSGMTYQENFCEDAQGSCSNCPQ